MNKELSIDEYLNLNEDSIDDFQDAYIFLSEYLSKLIVGSTYKDVYVFSGIIDKYTNFASTHNIDAGVIKELKNGSTGFFDILITIYTDKEYSQGEKQRMLPSFEFLYSRMLMIYNYINTGHRKNRAELLDLDDLFLPENSDKEKAIKNINEAIEFIKNDTSISNKTKEKLIKNLHTIINELLKPTTDWNLYYAKITEIVFILGALGSIVGGIVGASSLLSAKEKIETANNVIIKTSINLNYKNVHQVFNVDNREIEINNNQVKVLQLPEKIK